MQSIESIMTTSPVIPVIRIDNLDHAVPLAKALVKGGLKVLEVTLRTEWGLAAIADIKEHVPEATVGAGTVIDAQNYAYAVAAGAEFVVSPGCTAALAQAAQQYDVPMLPGIATPSEAMTLLEFGLQHLKFFPAQAAGGIPMLKSIAGPLPQLKFCPTGGVNPDNAADFLALENVLCVGGTWMLDQALIEAGDWSSIEARAKQAAAL